MTWYKVQIIIGSGGLIAALGCETRLAASESINRVKPTFGSVAYWERFMHWTYRQTTGLWAAILLAVFSVSGCTTSDTDPLYPEQRLLGRGIPTFNLDDATEPEPLTISEPDGALTLRKALALSLTRNPGLAANSWSIRAAEARSLQEGATPNPVFRVRVNDIGGTGDFRGVDNSEQAVRIGQIIELGGKAAKRQRAARLEAAMCGWDYETKRLDVFAGATKAFVVVLAAQKRLVAAQEMCDLAEKLLSLASKRLQGGGGVVMDIDEAKIELGDRRIELERAKQALDAARGLLANHWDEKTPRFQNVSGDLEDIAKIQIPAWEQVVGGIENNPDVSRWETETRLRDAAIEREKANAIPDLKVFVGGKRIEETGDQGYFVALEIPLPVFDRNQGAINEARANRHKAAYEQRAAIMATAAELRQAYQALSLSQREVKLLQTEILPAANAACAALENGALTAIKLVEAKQTLFKAKMRQIDALEVFHLSLADVERLTGQSITNLASPPANIHEVPAKKAPQTNAAKN
jgi:outer membrane protein, heavy metal efflux system